MQVSLEGLAHLENFFQLNFLFSGLEVSSTAVFLARLAALLVFGGGVIWIGFRVLMKALECLQTFLGSVGTLPKSFFLLILLVIPLSTDSLGARWVGYMLLVLSVLGLGALGVLVVVLWKYGVDQALRLISSLRTRSGVTSQDSSTSPETGVRTNGWETTAPFAVTRRDDASWEVQS